MMEVWRMRWIWIELSRDEMRLYFWHSVAFWTGQKGVGLGGIIATILMDDFLMPDSQCFQVRGLLNYLAKENRIPGQGFVDKV